MNRLFLGNPGTGKTTCAKLYGQILKHLNFLSNGDVVSKTASDFTGSHVGESAKKTNDIISDAKGKVLVIDEAYALDDNMYGKQVLDVLVEKIQGTPSDDIAVLLLGYEKPMLDMLRTQNPGLARRFPKEYAFVFEDYTDHELLQIFNAECSRQSVLTSSYEVSEKAIRVLSRERANPNFGNAGSVKLLLQNAITKASARQKYADNLCLVPEDIETAVASDADPFAPLNGLYNVENIKQGLVQLHNAFRVARAEGDETPEAGHFVFRGSAGTGKTTVARVMSNILFQLEILSNDRIVETSGLDLTGEYLGQTKKKVSEKLGQAKGGVLFIDEAYELGKGMYGEEAMTTLLEAMTSPEYKGMVIIIAGYPDDINEMLDRNQGLKSRFTQYFDFLDWLPNHCVDFFKDQAKRENFEIEDDGGDGREVLEFLREKFEVLRTLPGFANGRDVKRVWKDVLKFRASRVVDRPETEKTIRMEDVKLAIDAMMNARKVSPMSLKSKPVGDSEKTHPLLFDTASASPPATSFRQKEDVEEEKKEEQVQAPNQEEECEEGEEDITMDSSVRDAGVSDEDWEELEKAKREYFEKMASLKDKKSLLKEEIKKAKAIQEKIKKICPCPMGYAWTKVGGGWRCGGGSHFVSDKQFQLQDSFTF